MKSRIGMLAAMAFAIGSLDNENSSSTKMKDLPTDTCRKKRDEENLVRYYKSKGLRSFDIDGKTIWAKNYKNALRKSKL